MSNTEIPEIFTPGARRVADSIPLEAKRLAHHITGTYHFVAALYSDSAYGSVLANDTSVDAVAIRRKILDKVGLGLPETRELRDRPFSPDLSKLFSNARQIARNANRFQVSTEDLVHGLFQDESAGRGLLQELKVEEEMIIQAIRRIDLQIQP